MDLKEQLAQAKERKNGFLKAMPERTRTMITAYQKAAKVKNAFWLLLIGSIVVVGLFLVITASIITAENRWLVCSIFALVALAGLICLAVWICAFAGKMKKALELGATDYTDELNLIDKRIKDLGRANKKQDAADKKAARAAQKAEEARQEAINAVTSDDDKQA